MVRHSSGFLADALDDVHQPAAELVGLLLMYLGANIPRAAGSILQWDFSGVPAEPVSGSHWQYARFVCDQLLDHADAPQSLERSPSFVLSHPYKSTIAYALMGTAG